jgi:hypothetical protein
MGALNQVQGSSEHGPIRGSQDSLTQSPLRVQDNQAHEEAPGTFELLIATQKPQPTTSLHRKCRGRLDCPSPAPASCRKGN